ncbi:aminotransferase class I/II-fold pyridoxal phosphate-dependent enzyme [Schumannella sp. 10F1B-5-1]|uniref:aminotransferase class I/II-fold pyridoxal phosphate-dependent enzyme n=1 Tax=Schumannella sp. 10F1B-5-1 TaxID=2590780 RepID=UPI00112FDB65|nr:aminotransferase class I/II-fold pyridoxal phosphate-dependent enzyme [Schumannella sp. 10F1B-5-1]TPW73208.1 aminotransferase class I/II-fold pyridoxal phosphate-dependent enzyme [Schumannella sp. 10F1B-5-1]
MRTARAAGLLGPDGVAHPTIFAEMSALAVERGALNLGQGFPDEDGPAEVLETARRAISDGVNQYPPGRGIPELRQAIADHQRRFRGLDWDADREVLVTAGATEAIAASLLAFVGAGDEVVVIEPFYDSYAALVGLAGGRLVPVPARAPDFLPDPDELRAAVTDRTAVILINSPHNPTGAMLPDETLRLVVELAERHDAIVVSDEVYEHLTFERPHRSIGTIEGARGRAITVSSAAKTFNVTGWKIGWITATPELVDAVLAVKQFLTYVNGAPFQPAVAVGLALPEAYFTGAAEKLRARRDLLTASLESAGFAVNRPGGSYFLIADGAPLGLHDGVATARRLVDEVGVVGIPVSAFTVPEHAEQFRSLLRFTFAKSEATTTAAARQLGGFRA